jgi:hypothetical protein
VALPRVNTRFAELVSVAVVPGTREVWAVGTYTDEKTLEHALAMRYVPCEAGEGVPGGIPGMPGTGAEGSKAPIARTISTIFYDLIATFFTLFRYLDGVF